VGAGPLAIARRRAFDRRGRAPVECAQRNAGAIEQPIAIAPTAKGH